MSDEIDYQNDERFKRGGAPKGNNNAVGNDGGAPEGNANAMTHGVTANPANLYRHLDDEEAEWIDRLTGAYVEQLGFENDDPRIERVKRACIHIYQSWQGEDRILADGLSEKNHIGVDERGEPVVAGQDGHHLHRFTFKRDQEARAILKDLGAFDDPQSQTADAINNAADQWERMLNGE